MPAETMGKLKQGLRTKAHERILEVAPGVVCIRLSIVNAYLVSATPTENSGEWILVDAGLQTSAASILRAVEDAFGESSRPMAILLTHGHFDHVGALKELIRHWDVPVYAHRLEMPYLTGKSSYPPPDPFVGGGAMALLSPAYPRSPVDLGSRVLPLPDDGSIPGLPAWSWIHTPGHTPGHVSLYRASDGVLLAGDAFVTTRQESLAWAVAQPQEVNGPPSYFTQDWFRAHQSVEMLANLQPNIAATGHGRPMSGPRLQGQLHALARNFRRLAVPERGRYVTQPAAADEQGVFFIPPAVAPPAWSLFAGFAAGMALAALLPRKHGGTEYRDAPYAKAM